MPVYIILSAAVLVGLFVFFLTLIRVIFIRLIGIYARFGAGSGSHFLVVPPFCLRISFNLFFLACKRKLPLLSPVSVLWLCLLFLFYNFTIARPPCQTGGRSVYSTYNYLRYLSIKIGARAKRQKSLVYQRFSAFSPSVFRPFSMYKNCPHNVQVLPPMMYKDCPLNVQTLPPYNWISTAVYAFPSLMALYPFIYRSFFQ